MNWFEKLILNANTHNLGAAGLLLGGIFFPEVIPLAKAAAGAVGLSVTGAALPGGSILPSPPTPIAEPLSPVKPGSLHTEDYVNLVAEVLRQVKAKSGRS